MLKKIAQGAFCAIQARRTDDMQYMHWLSPFAVQQGPQPGACKGTYEGKLCAAYGKNTENAGAVKAAIHHKHQYRTDQIT